MKPPRPKTESAQRRRATTSGILISTPHSAKRGNTEPEHVKTEGKGRRPQSGKPSKPQIKRAWDH